MRSRFRTAAMALGLCLAACGSHAAPPDLLRTQALDFAAQQLAATVVEVANPALFPRSTRSNGTWMTTDSQSWTSGFFPGCLWLMAEATGDPIWIEHARAWTAAMEREKTDTSSHDVGFKILCSFGNGYRLTGDASYPEVIRRGAQSLATRYSSLVGCTRSWNNYTFPVIIDNMMNLEILFWGAAHGGSSTWTSMATNHGLRTRSEHVRADASTYHLVDFDPRNGAVLDRMTVQGWSDESTWARGQAWGLYGFTMAARETQDARFLSTATALADWFIDHLPADRVPYWDFQAPGIPAEPKDTSAAAIAASGLFELSTLVSDTTSRMRYFDAAASILAALCSPPYLASGSASHGILLHGVGNRPANSEVDVSLIYGDYYFLEALLRSERAASDARLPSGSSTFTAFPNPARGDIALRFVHAAEGRFSLRIFDARGEHVRTLVEARLGPGTVRFDWDGRAEDGLEVPSGTYFCVLRSGSESQVRKLTWVR